jgi:cytochrome c-type protein NapC
MSITVAVLLGFMVVAALLVGTLVLRPHITASRGGKMLAFVALFLVPLAVGGGGVSTHIDNSKSTSFCLSCHIMKPYGQSLRVDDPSYLAGSHFINHRVPPESACYTCHTDYTMFGDVKAKMRGLRHVWVWATQDRKPPLHLYNPYPNQNCLHCHAGAKSFEEGAVHNADPETMPQIKSGKLGCTSSGCHDTVHNAMKLQDVKFYGEAGK